LLSKKNIESKQVVEVEMGKLKLTLETGAEMAELRKITLKKFIKFKRLVRSLISETIPYQDKINRLRRQKALLEAQNLSFNDHHINKVQNELEDAQSALEAIEDRIARFDGPLYILCIYADKFLSYHDHAQILGVNHISLKNIVRWHSEILNKKDEGLYSLISEFRGEYRGNADFIELDNMNQMPLYTVHYHHFFPNSGPPNYQSRVSPEGTWVFERLPPKFEVINGEKE
jgi:hypothetical protein